jgi:hypothetical protein
MYMLWLFVNHQETKGKGNKFQFPRKGHPMSEQMRNFLAKDNQ